MGWSEMERRCQRHPQHKQSKGVCPYCLRERLSHISASSSMTNNSSSRSSPYSSDTISSSSSVASPPRQDQKERIPFSGLLGKTEPLKKSRSLAFFIAKSDREGKIDEKEKARRKKKEEKKKKKKGFWSKLLGGSGYGGNKRRKEKDVKLHSRTMKETSSTKWFLPY